MLSSTDLLQVDPKLLQVDPETKLSVGRRRSENLRAWLPLIFAATAYLILLTRMRFLLIDSDIYWHIVVGQWIVDHHAVPHTDPFSFTMNGQPWITSEWLSEIIYFAAFKLAGWVGPAVLAALSAAVAFFLLTHLLLKRLPNIPVAILVGSGIAMAAPHMLARPHILVFSLMVLWADALVRAAEERRAPSLAYLPVVAVWANLHGSFTLGLALMVPFAFEAVWTGDKSTRRSIALQWLRFGSLALGAACITPYGPESILVTLRVLRLGAALSMISEWGPQNFGTFNAFAVCLLAGIAYALYNGLKLPPLRIAALLAVVYQTLVHQRYVDVAALVAPFFIAGPLSQHLSQPLSQVGRRVTVAMRRVSITAITLLIITSGVIIATMDHTPPLVPRVAVEKLKGSKAQRVLNDYYFGGYLIYEGIPTFIDGRAELYGPTVFSRYVRDIQLGDVADFVRLLDENNIDATLLFPSTPAAGLLDRLPGWKRIYADDVAVVHVRSMHPGNSNYLK